MPISVNDDNIVITQPQQGSVVVTQKDSVVVDSDDTNIDVNVDPTIDQLIEVVSPGPQGPPGEEGPPSSTVGGTYTHVQTTAESVWEITHNLGFFPNVTVIDSAGSEVEGQTEYIDPNVVRLTFLGAFTGQAYLS